MYLSDPDDEPCYVHDYANMPFETAHIFNPSYDLLTFVLYLDLFYANPYIIIISENVTSKQLIVLYCNLILLYMVTNKYYHIISLISS